MTEKFRHQIRVRIPGLNEPILEGSEVGLDHELQVGEPYDDGVVRDAWSEDRDYGRIRIAVVEKAAPS